nr:hypothetical protein [Tanacetum cinerariifolium]
MRPFGCPVTILNTLDTLGKFKRKVNEGFMVGYSINSKAFRVFNSRTYIIQETLHVNFLENKPNVAGTGPTWLFDIDSLTRTMNYQPVTTGNQTNPSAGFQDTFDADKAGKEANLQYVLFPVWSTGSSNPQNKDGDTSFDEKEHDAEKPESAVNLSPSRSALLGENDDMTKKKDKGKSPVEYFSEYRDLNAVFEDFSEDSSNNVSAASPIVPTTGAAGPLNSNSSLTHGQSSLRDTYQPPDMVEREDIVYSDHENVGAEADFNNLETSITVNPIPTTRTHNAHPISQIIGHTQEEGIDYEEVFAPVARIEAIRLFLAYASFMGFMVYHIDVKSAFLYETIEEEAPRAWYETLANYLLKNGFHRGEIDQTLFIKKQKGDILLVQIYVDDIIFGLQVKQKKDGIFISQDKYVAKILNKFRLTEGKSACTPIDTKKPLLKDSNGEDVNVHIYKSMIGSLMYLTSSRPDIMFAVCAYARFQVTPKASHLHAMKRIFRYLKGKPNLGLWYPKDSPFDLVAYSDSDYAGASLDRKSTTRGCQFLGCRLISWQCKKQTVAATSSTEAEYIAGASCYAQVLWIQNQMLDYGLQALVDKKRVVVTEAAIRDVLHLDDAEGVDCLPNEEIFTELARMGYEKPTTKLTFYKALFSSQWKFLIYKILQSMCKTHMKNTINLKFSFTSMNS